MLKVFGIGVFLLTVGAPAIFWATWPHPLPATSTDSCSVSVRDPRFVCTCRATVPGHMEAACELFMEPALDPDEFVQ